MSKDVIVIGNTSKPRSARRSGVALKPVCDLWTDDRSYEPCSRWRRWSIDPVVSENICMGRGKGGILLFSHFHHFDFRFDRIRKYIDRSDVKTEHHRQHPLRLNVWNWTRPTASLIDKISFWRHHRNKLNSNKRRNLYQKFCMRMKKNKGNATLQYKGNAILFRCLVWIRLGSCSSTNAYRNEELLRGSYDSGKKLILTNNVLGNSGGGVGGGGVL